MTLSARKKSRDIVVSVDTVNLDNGTWLLWEDRRRVLARDRDADRVRVSARGAQGWVAEAALGGATLLELHLSDVG